MDCQWAPWETYDHTYPGIRKDGRTKTVCKNLKCDERNGQKGQGTKTRRKLTKKYNGGKDCIGDASEVCFDYCPGIEYEENIYVTYITCNDAIMSSKHFTKRYHICS